MEETLLEQEKLSLFRSVGHSKNVLQAFVPFFDFFSDYVVNCLCITAI